MKIIWTRRARTQFTDILDYIEREFGEGPMEHFKTKTKEFTVLLKEFPEIGTLEVPGKKNKRISTDETNQGFLQT
ncbi:MAG: type II toxin-antitoxin system RelE/ParE family toxin [Cyclobacteriaceae bacterium]